MEYKDLFYLNSPIKASSIFDPTMLIVVLFQCFKYVLGPPYQPLGENDVGNDPPLPFNEPRWVLVNFPHSPPYPPNVPHPQCILDRAHNYMLETHPSILGTALFPANANGPSAIYPRYYIMKRRVTYPGIQVLALLTPEARQMQPNRFRNQLLSIFCQNGYVDINHRSSQSCSEAISNHDQRSNPSKNNTRWNMRYRRKINQNMFTR